MATTQRPAVSARASRAAHARAEDDAQRIEHIQKSLEAVQKDLIAIGGHLGTGVRDLRRDAIRLVRDARRDLLKMQKALQRDLDRLQKDLMAAAAPPKPARATSATRRGRSTTSRTSRRQTAASSH